MTFTGVGDSVRIQEPMDVKNEGQIRLGAGDQSAPECQGSQKPIGGSAVSALVAKSKKAAYSLFTLLHAKNCKLGVHRCLHPGCPEAKLIYLHLKTCSVADSEPCPTNHKGCADSRKLLHHYRCCREIRSRQVANRSTKPQHICLVCSLVARHAKGSSERNRSSSPGPKGIRVSRHLIPSLNLSTDGKTDTAVRQRARSTSPHRDTHLWPTTTASKVPMKMAPPPPKFSFSGRRVTGNQYSANDDSRHAPIEFGLRQRPRAESLDLRRARLHEDSSDEESAHVDSDGPNGEEPSGENPTVHRRRRSASCSVLSSPQSGSVPFDPILEEQVGNELQEILEGEQYL